MDEILRKLEEFESRLTAMEQRLGMRVGVSAIPPSPPPYIPEPTTSGSKFAPAAPAPVFSQPLHRKNIEQYIGRWLLGVVGMVAILFGASFFLKYAFDNNLIGETGRVLLGLAGGLLLVILGEWLRGRFPKYSYILSGGGLGLLYLSIYGAFHFYDLIGQSTAFGFMGAVTAFGVALALWANGVELAALAAAGGFLTPFLLSTSAANDVGFFGYLFVLNLGILAVAFFKKWHPLTLLGFAATVLNFVSWYGAYYETDKLSFTVTVLAAFYIIYALAGVISNIATKKRSDMADLVILTLNPAWFFGWLYFLLRPEYEAWLGFIAAALGAVYILLASVASAVSREDSRLTLFLGGIAVVFLTIAIPLQLDQNAITIAWAVEAAVLFTLGIMLANPFLRMSALGVFLIALFRLFAFDSDPGNLAEFTPIFNRRFFTYLMVMVAGAVMAGVSIRRSDAIGARERGTQAFLGLAVSALFLVAVTLEIWSFYDAKLFALEDRFRREQARRTPVAEQSPYEERYYGDYEARSQARQSGEYRSLTNQRNALVSVFWTMYAILLITLGILYRNAFLRWSALALFGITAIKVFIFDLAGLRTPYRIISFTVLGVILLIASYLYFRYEKRLTGQNQT